MGQLECKILLSEIIRIKIWWNKFVCLNQVSTHTPQICEFQEVPSKTISAVEHSSLNFYFPSTPSHPWPCAIRISDPGEILNSYTMHIWSRRKFWILILWISKIFPSAEWSRDNFKNLHPPSLNTFCIIACIESVCGKYCRRFSNAMSLCELAVW